MRTPEQKEKLRLKKNKREAFLFSKLSQVEEYAKSGRWPSIVSKDKEEKKIGGWWLWYRYFAKLQDAGKEPDIRLPKIIRKAIKALIVKYEHLSPDSQWEKNLEIIRHRLIVYGELWLTTTEDPFEKSMLCWFYNQRRNINALQKNKRTAYKLSHERISKMEEILELHKKMRRKNRKKRVQI